MILSVFDQSGQLWRWSRLSLIRGYLGLKLGLIIVWLRFGQWSEFESGPWSGDGLIRTHSVWKVWSEIIPVWKVWSEIILVWKIWSEIILGRKVWSEANLGLDLNLGCLVHVCYILSEVKQHYLEFKFGITYLIFLRFPAQFLCVDVYSI